MQKHGFELDDFDKKDSCSSLFVTLRGDVTKNLMEIERYVDGFEITENVFSNR